MPDADVTYPGAGHRDRTYRLDAHGIGLATYEWGDAGAPPLLVAHGGFDFAGTYDVFAPLLADGGWRVVAGTSGATATPTTPRSTAGTPTCATPSPCSTRQRRRPGAGRRSLQGRRRDDAAGRRPAPPRQPRSSTSTACRTEPHRPDVADHERTRMLAGELAGWLEHRRGPRPASAPAGHARRAGRAPRPDEPAAVDRVAALPRDRRRAPGRRRLALEDRPDDALRRLRAVAAGVVAAAAARAVACRSSASSAGSPRRWAGARARATCAPYLPPGAALRDPRRRRPLRAHRARPTWSPTCVLDFLGGARDRRCARHTAGRARPARAAGGDGPAAAPAPRARRASPADGARRGWTAWPGPVVALDFTGHGAVRRSPSAAATPPRS